MGPFAKSSRNGNLRVRMMAAALAATAALLSHAGSYAFCKVPQATSWETLMQGPFASAVHSPPHVARSTDSGQAMSGVLKGVAITGLVCAVAVRRTASSCSRAGARRAIVLRKVTLSSPVAPVRRSPPVQEFCLFDKDDEMPTELPPYSVDVVVPRALRRKNAKKSKKEKKVKKLISRPTKGFTFEDVPTKRTKKSSLFSTALMGAASSGDLVKVKALVEITDVNERDAHGLSALAYAVLANQTKAAKILLQKGADVNIVTKSGVTPLMMAVSNCCYYKKVDYFKPESMVYLLLREQADPLLSDKVGMNALQYAIRGGKLAAKVRKIINQSVAGTMDRQQEIIEWLKLR